MSSLANSCRTSLLSDRMHYFRPNLTFLVSNPFYNVHEYTGSEFGMQSLLQSLRETCEGCSPGRSLPIAEIMKGGD